MAAVQMNVRLDDALKREGDEVFSDAGFTSTEVVRAVWGFARRNRHNRRAVVDLMRSLRDPQEVEREQAAREKRIAEAEDWLERGSRIIRDYYAQFGIDYDSLPPLTHEDYDRLLEEAYAEKYPELWAL